MSDYTSFNLLICLILTGMLGSLIGTVIAWALAVRSQQGWKAIRILRYGFTYGIAVSAVGSLATAALWLALAPTVGVAFWATICTTSVVRLIFSLSMKP